MQRIIDALNGGYSHWVKGEVPLARAAALVQKLQGRFPGLKRDRHFAHRQRVAGRPRHKLIVHINRSGAQAVFHLFTDLPRLEDREPWADAREKAGRVVLYQYQALRITKPNYSGPAWTWRIHPLKFAGYWEFARACIRSKDGQPVHDMIRSAASWPGFAGVRLQKTQLEKRIEGEWRRSMPKGSELPAWPRLRYVQRIRSR